MGIRDTQNVYNLIGRLNYSKTKFDDELSDTSTNAVQNKVIKEALDGKVSKSGDTMSGTLNMNGSSITNVGVFTLASGNQPFNVNNRKIINNAVMRYW